MPHTASPSYRATLIDVIPLEMEKEESLLRLQELESLLNTFGGISVVQKIQKRNTPNYQTYVGSGTLQSAIEEAKALKCNLFIMNNILKPKQIYELGEILRPHKIQIWDRIELILNIFSLHAQSAEAKLQIELAKIRHMGPRIFGMGSELSRQGGGIGTSGIGETNTEIMKRHLKKQEMNILKKLEKLETVKRSQQKRRRRQGLKTVSLIGYTNAGKSTLMRTLTGKKHIKVADELFATLDTRIGNIYLPQTGQSILISDTIGFIADLPPKLISAFTSTLSETLHADILLHVVDTADPQRETKIQVVDQVLADLNASEKKQILIWNKTDLCKRSFGKKKLLQKYADRNPVFVSALQKESLEILKHQIEEVLFSS